MKSVPVIVEKNINNVAYYLCKMMTPKEFLKFKYEIDTEKWVFEMDMLHPTFVAIAMEEYLDYVLLCNDIKERDPDTALHEYKIKLMEDIKLGFDLCSDTSAFCLGYRNLCDKIRREKENKPIDRSISPIKPYTDNNE